MGARTGAEFIAGLRDQREVWLGNERVEDVTTHPAFRAAVESVAQFIRHAARPGLSRTRYATPHRQAAIPLVCRF